jgi:DNA-binding transcriptional ArsR family regulator
MRRCDGTARMTARLVRRHERARRRPSLRRSPLVEQVAEALAEELAEELAGQMAGREPEAPVTTQAIGDSAAQPAGGNAASLSSAQHLAPVPITAEARLAFAREAYAIRRRRDRHLPADLFGEPTWYILLDLYVATRENRPVPTTSACIGADVPPTTALRWLRILEARGLVEREEDGHDGRRTFVRLSAQGLAAMDDWLHVALATLHHAVSTILRQTPPMAEAAE